MYTKKVCVILRHPTIMEGQTALARGFLRVLKIIYGDYIDVIVTTAGSRISYKYPFYVQEFVRVFSSSYCKVVHLLNVNKPLTSVVGLIGVSDLVTYQFSYLPEVHGLWRVKRALIDRGSRLVIGTSRRISELFSKGLFTYPPVNTELFKPRDKVLARRILRLPLDKVIVGYVGDIDDGRGFDVVAKLAATLGNDNIKFLVSYLRVDNIKGETVKYLKEALRRNTLIIKRVLPVWYVYNAVDVLLLPINKAYPTEPPATLVEALASGTPVIGGSSPTMQDYESLYVKVRSSSDYADAVINAISNGDVLSELSVKSREFAVRNLSYHSVAQNLSSHLRAWER